MRATLTADVEIEDHDGTPMTLSAGTRGEIDPDAGPPGHVGFQTRAWATVQGGGYRKGTWWAVVPVGDYKEDG